MRRRAVADAFDPRYGARTVKRWLEDKIGGALTDLLATAPPARLRIVRLSEDAGAIAATLEPMLERTPAPGPVRARGRARSRDRRARALDRDRPPPRSRGSRASADARAPAIEATGELRYYVDELASA